MRAHANTKFKSFREELDTSVFSCLGQADGCYRLMQDIATRPGFVPEATWLIIFRKSNGNIESCGTIQGVQTEPHVASIQNIGIIPGHRGKRLGSVLIYHALLGFQQLDLMFGNLEVTAHNTGAVRLYRNLGFELTQVVYKTAEFQSH